MTNSISEALEADVIIVTGSNTTETHPVIGAKIRQALMRGARLIVAEPRRIALAGDADIFLQITPGTNIALFNGLLNIIINEGLIDEAFIAERTDGFDKVAEAVREYTPQRVAEICGIDREPLIEAARMYASAEKAAIYYAMGITQFTTGTHGVMSLSNLALATGNVGREGCGLNPLRGQNNVQGACDMGCLPNVYTGYQPVGSAAISEKFSKAWGVSELPATPGLTLTEIIDKAGEDVRFLYIMGENSALSDPNLNRFDKQVAKLSFLVVQDIFLTETARLADVVLPAACFAEKDGTFTNTERRVSRVRRAADAPGGARPDWEIISLIMERLGYVNRFMNEAEIFEEIAAVTPSYSGITYERLESGGLQWPCKAPSDAGTKTLHTNGFARQNQKALFVPVSYEPPTEQTDGEYPFMLITGRTLNHYHTRTMTGKTRALNQKSGGPYIEINPADALRLGILEGGAVTVSTRRGEVTAAARITETVKEGVVFTTFHFAEAAANYLTSSDVDAVSRIPQYKLCACGIRAVK